MKYAWIDTARRGYPLPVLCNTLAVSISGYRAWKRGGQSRRHRLTDAQLLELIRAITFSSRAPTAAREWSTSCVAVGSRRARHGWSG